MTHKPSGAKIRFQGLNIIRQEACILSQPLCALGHCALRDANSGRQLKHPWQSALWEADFMVQHLKAGLQTRSASISRCPVLIFRQIRMNAAHRAPTRRTRHHRNAIFRELLSALSSIQALSWRLKRSSPLNPQAAQVFGTSTSTT
ncbi:hypothetical protein EHF33_20270 (plasmid) [Deinococcus psychrotolerans]|uniref:Uncharacterized protein n=1 Tax=Deinococcus psychrotolerans TaxID=2489213 RepID=A0A3G8YVM9_9DEIO|nr:hypothetical protein [Deinococcus psychrotolerans]AZI45246.1 hypothetical protein EHF33_20270 [Deinococcus psychrotolerans]